MTRNQKIALGCGGAGCLGLIVVVIAAGLIYLFSGRRTYSTNRNYNYNYNVNTRNRNYNSNAKANDNDNSSSSTSTSTPASSLSADDKHKLYQAASMTGDGELIRRVSVKIGLMNEDYTPGDDYQKFIAEHVTWAIRNTDFIQSINTTEKARAYVNANFPD
jgi:hypothetical protein